MDIAKLVGPEAIDPLRSADYYVEPFQNRSQFADAPTRIAAFECFVLRCLDLLQSHSGLNRFGLRVQSQTGFEYLDPEQQMPRVIVKQNVTLIAEGDVRPLVNPQEFYETCFPFSGVFSGEFTLTRTDPRVQRYLDATARSLQDDDRRCMLSLLSAEAEQSFSNPALEIRPSY